MNTLIIEKKMHFSTYDSVSNQLFSYWSAHYSALKMESGVKMEIDMETEPEAWSACFEKPTCILST